MELRPQLWCVHVLGPDDVYAAPDVVTAARWAAALNYACYHMNQDISDDDYVICHANVEPWSGTAEDHAAYLPQSIALCTPKRGVIPPGQLVEIDYTNHEGRRSIRRIKPTGRMLVGLDKRHPDAPWVIEARDVDRGVMRTFDPAKIHRWGSAPSTPLCAWRSGCQHTIACAAERRCIGPVLNAGDSLLEQASRPAPGFERVSSLPADGAPPS